MAYTAPVLQPEPGSGPQNLLERALQFVGTVLPVDVKHEGAPRRDSGLVAAVAALEVCERESTELADELVDQTGLEVAEVGILAPAEQ